MTPKQRRSFWAERKENSIDQHRAEWTHIIELKKGFGLILAMSKRVTRSTYTAPKTGVKIGEVCNMKYRETRYLRLDFSTSNLSLCVFMKPRVFCGRVQQ